MQGCSDWSVGITGAVGLRSAGGAALTWSAARWALGLCLPQRPRPWRRRSAGQWWTSSAGAGSLCPGWPRRTQSHHADLKHHRDRNWTGWTNTTAIFALQTHLQGQRKFSDHNPVYQVLSHANWKGGIYCSKFAKVNNGNTLLFT